MAKVCCCGNDLDEKPDGFTVRMHPCRCEKPAGRRQSTQMQGLPWHVFKQQYEERKRLGLPILTDIEKGARSKWS
jgi:hypothetical protein